MSYLRLAAAIAIVAGLFTVGWVVNGWRLSAKLAACELRAAVLTQAIEHQNTAAREADRFAKELRERVKVAEARQPVIETRTIERVRTVVETQPAPTAPCVEVMQWERAQFSLFVQQYSQR